MDSYNDEPFKNQFSNSLTVKRLIFLSMASTRYKSIFLFEFCKFRNRPYPLFYFHRQLYKVKGKFSIEIFMPWMHVYYEYNPFF